MELEIAPKVSDDDVHAVCLWMPGIESLHTIMKDDQAWTQWRERMVRIQRESVERLARRYFDAGRELQKKLDA